MSWPGLTNFAAIAGQGAQALRQWHTEAHAADPAVALGAMEFIRTNVIEEMLRKPATATGASGWATDEVLLPHQQLLGLVLRRHLTHLSTRRNSAALIHFWKWATSSHPELGSFWEQANLPLALESPSIARQEEALGQILQKAAQSLQQVSGVEWATGTVKHLAEWWNQPRHEVRIVFAWPDELDVPPSFRSGFLVRFRLLKEVALGQELIKSPAILGAQFKDALQAIRVRCNDKSERFRYLDHDSGFLGKGDLNGPSGTMGLYLAQWLAGAARFEGRYFCLPPWTVISSALDPTFGLGEDAPVGLLKEKAQVLIEEGVRVLGVSIDQAEASKGGGFESSLHDHPANGDLKVLALQGEVHQIARTLKLAWALIPADPSPQSGPFLPEAPEPTIPLSKRRKSQFLEYLEDDYIPPTHFLEAIDDAISKLPGKGYIHLMADGMMGKSVLVRMMSQGQHSATTLRYAILHGSLENPSNFYNGILRQAQRLSDDEDSSGLHDRILQIKGQPPRTQEEMQELIVKVMDAVKQRYCGKAPLILAIDGLDELTVLDDRERGRSIDQLLPPVSMLPEGCYVLLTSRPELRAEVQKVIDGIHAKQLFGERTFDTNNTDYRQTLRQFLVKSFGSAIQPHMDAMLAQARYRFLWLRFLRDLIRLGGQPLDQANWQLPEGDSIFPAYLSALENKVNGGSVVFQSWHWRILLLIAAAKTPVSRLHLRWWLEDDHGKARAWNQAEEEQLDLALDELKALLNDDTASLKDDTLYSIGHRELQEWLVQVTGEDGAKLIDTAHSAINRAGMRQLSQGCFEPIEALDRAGEYSLVHLADHLLAMSKHERAWQWIDRTRSYYYQFSEYLDRLQRFDRLIEICTSWIGQLSALFWEAGGFHRAIAVRPGLVNLSAAVNMTRGGAHNKRQNFDAAIHDYDRAIDLLEKLIASAGGESKAVSQQPGPVYHLAGAYLNRGVATHDKQNFDAAIADYVQAIALIEKLIVAGGGMDRAVTGQPGLVNDLAGALINRGNAQQHKQNFEAAIEHLGRAIALIERLIAAGGGIDRAVTGRPRLVNDLANAHTNWGVAKEGKQNFDAAIKDYDRAAALCEKLIESAGGMERAVFSQPRLVNNLANVLINRGNAHRQKQNFDAAIEDDNRAISLREKLIAAAGGEDRAVISQPGLVNDLANAHTNRGNAEQNKQNFDAAIEDYDRAIALRETIIESAGGMDRAVTGQPGLVNDLANAHMNRGNANLRKQNFEAAIEDYDCAIALREKLTESAGGMDRAVISQPRLVNDLAGAHINRGNAQQDKQNFDVAIVDYVRAIELNGKLIAGAGGMDRAVAGQPGLVNDLANAHMNRGNAQLSKQNFDAAIKDFDRAIALREKLIESAGSMDRAVTGQPGLVNDLANAHMNRGVAKHDKQNFEAAIEDHDRAISLRGKLIAAAGGEDRAVISQPGLVNDLADAHMNRGNAQLSKQNFDAAIKDFDRAIALREKLIESAGSMDRAVTGQPGLVNDLADTHTNRGVAKHDKQNFEAAIEDHDRAISLRGKLIAGAGGEDRAVISQPGLVNDLANAHMDRGVAKHEKQKFDAAIEDYDRAIALREKLIESAGSMDRAVTGRPRLVNDLGKAHMNRGNTHLRRQNFDAAIEDYGRTIELLEKSISAASGREIVAKYQPATIALLAEVLCNRSLAFEKIVDPDRAAADRRAAQILKYLLNRDGRQDLLG